jgi:hypothetical protein
MPPFAICLLVEANALAADSRATSATAMMCVQERVSKEFSSEYRALLGARIGLKFMSVPLFIYFFVDLLLLFLAILLLELHRLASTQVLGLPDRSPAAVG